MLKFLKSHKLLTAIGVIAVIAIVSAGLFRYRLVQAELTNMTLIEREKLLEQAFKLDRESRIAKDRKRNELLLEYRGKLLVSEKYTESIITKKDGEIKALRFMAGSWEDKYNRIEPECLQLSAKVESQETTIGILHLTVSELELQVKDDREYIDGLELKFKECQRLLDISIANTKSILRKSWVLKLFDKVKFGPVAIIGTDIKSHFGLGIMWAVN